ncbi:alpha-L-fucosidase isoform X2 [Lycorma delicatula]|uniref:alpha-L-fucosidase isoform X2 n=1 Tax=Lycorma delicatula TaxID=130591 RepID=UPI003F5145FA
MFLCCFLLTCMSVIVFAINVRGEAYKPDWKSLDARPLPPWYDEAKIGIFIHWGVYSVPSFASEWFWINWKNGRSDIIDFMNKNYRPGFTYQEFAPDFTAEFFSPQEWAELFRESGAKYVIFTSKHHEGYAMWPSKYSFSWNSVDVGPHRDLIGELSTAVREAGLHFGLYHSLFEWFNPLYLEDKNNNFTTQLFVNNKIIPEMKELVNKYKPDIIWSDGEWEALDSYWKSKEFLAWLYNESPVQDNVVVNDRWGSNTLCKHGGFLTCQDRYNPGVLQERKWENALTIDSESWGFRRNANLEDFLTTKALITFLAETVSCNGNIAFNVGPTKDGVITPIYQQKLYDVGKWLKINGPAIYKSKPWSVCQNDTLTPGVWYTTNKSLAGTIDLYAIVLNWPNDNIISLECPLPSERTVVTLLGFNSTLNWADKFIIKFPDRAVVTSDWAWTLKITYISNIVGNDQNDGNKSVIKVK